jgi:hypothetical protein
MPEPTAFGGPGHELILRIVHAERPIVGRPVHFRVDEIRDPPERQRDGHRDGDAIQELEEGEFVLL